LNKTFNYYKHRISYLTGTCYNFEMEEFLFPMIFFHRFCVGYASISWAFLY